MQSLLLDTFNPWPEEFIKIHPNVFGPSDRVLFSNKNPFWKSGRALVLWTEGSHLIVFVHSDYLHHQKPYAAFGYWSGEPSELFSAAESWAKEQGALELTGPLNFKTAYDYRFRLDHFGEIPFWGEPGNSDRDPLLLSELGFECVHRYFTDLILDFESVRRIGRERLPPLLRDFSRLRIEKVQVEEMLKLREEILSIANRSFSKNPRFVPLDPFDMAVLYPAAVVERACPATSMLIYDASDRLVGFCFTFADPRAPKRLLVKTVALLDEERYGGRGFVYLLNWLFENSSDYQEIAFCLMNEGNAVQRLTKKFADRSQSYGLFAKPLN